MKKVKRKITKKTRRKNPHELPRPTKSLPPRWLREKVPEHFAHYGEPAGRAISPTQGINIAVFGVQPPKRVPENINEAFELGRLLGFKRGLDCKHVKLAENIYKILLANNTEDEFFDNIFTQINNKYEAFRSGIIWGMHYAIRFCGMTKILHRRQELQKTNREIAQKFWEYL